MFRSKCYDIVVSTAKEKCALAPEFSVEINHSTLAMDEIDKFANDVTSGFVFSIINNNKLKISITPQTPFDDQDRLFRSACAMLTRYKLTLKSCSEIIQAYETHLSRHSVYSQYSPKKSPSSSIRINSHHAH
jgi:hypothetical protein